MNISGWGNYPKINSNITTFTKVKLLRQQVENLDEFIPFGNGRSYGDSAINTNVIVTTAHNRFLSFDKTLGLLHVQSGILLSEILEVIVPKGWFLKVTPGTKLITVGGAIASDVHGKNHHIEGCFSECVKEFNLMLPNGDIMMCSKNVNPELYQSTCGGMGLTGVILDATLSLKRINSKFIEQVTIKTKNLKDTFALFEENYLCPYSVAWIDCFSKKEKLGRSLLLLGNFSDDGDLNYTQKTSFNIPFYFPSFVLNKWSIKLFNIFYYNKVRKRQTKAKVELDTFFYPLDSINHWNRIYGKNGFTQYQFILPKNNSYRGIVEALELISASGKGSFLAVLKLYGKSNNNFLSFPLEGYSLALDFKLEPKLFPLLDQLDEIVLKYQGRIYLSKDVRVNKKTFEKGYHHIKTFREIRKKYGMYDKLKSLQSKRLEI